MVFHFRVNREEDHAHIVSHIGQRTGLIAAAFEIVAGSPGVVLVRHFEKITRVQR